MPEGGNIAAELAEDHEHIQSLLTEALALSPGDGGRRSVINEASVWLLRHSTAEERYLYPAIREHLPDGARLARDQERDQAHVAALVEAVAGRDEQDEVFEDLLHQLFIAVGEHIATQDTTLFPLLLDACPPDQADDLARLVQSVRRGGLRRV
ncbi:MAG TPA: hemerythrin domain-containing protein [Actinocrinis sp.]|nr:hemerythrin domain-containing protein [Actinocrinis sp.]